MEFPLLSTNGATYSNDSGHFIHPNLWPLADLSITGCTSYRGRRERPPRVCTHTHGYTQKVSCPFERKKVFEVITCVMRLLFPLPYPSLLNFQPVHLDEKKEKAITVCDKSFNPTRTRQIIKSFWASRLVRQVTPLMKPFDGQLKMCCGIPLNSTSTQII